MDKYENKEICKNCGGQCCKKSGCDYFVSDFETIKLQSLEEILQTGRVSIIATFTFQRLNNGKLVYTPILSLRARNTNRDIIDLFSFKTQCASLEEHGCYYDISKRPSGGAALIPQVNGPCYSEVDRIAELNKWLPYQKVLEKMVKRYTQMTVSDKIKADVETVIYNYLSENYQDSMDREIQDIKEMMPLLSECFPEEFLNATRRALLIPKKKSRTLK